MRNREEFLKLASVKTSTFKVPSLNNYEILMKELTIAESNEFREIMSDENKKPIDAIMFACRCSCVEPTFFTDEELKKLRSFWQQRSNGDMERNPTYRKNKR